MKWEYKQVFWGRNSGVGTFNKLGEEGWELVTICDNCAIFKRVIPSESILPEVVYEGGVADYDSWVESVKVTKIEKAND